MTTGVHLFLLFIPFFVYENVQAERYENCPAMNMFRIVAPELLSAPAGSLEWFDVGLRIRFHILKKIGSGPNIQISNGFTLNFPLNVYKTKYWFLNHLNFYIARQKLRDIFRGSDLKSGFFFSGIRIRSTPAGSATLVWCLQSIGRPQLKWSSRVKMTF